MEQNATLKFEFIGFTPVLQSPTIINFTHRNAKLNFKVQNSISLIEV
jgi:hypothetical protein